MRQLEFEFDSGVDGCNMICITGAHSIGRR